MAVPVADAGRGRPAAVLAGRGALGGGAGGARPRVRAPDARGARRVGPGPGGGMSDALWIGGDDDDRRTPSAARAARRDRPGRPGPARRDRPRRRPPTSRAALGPAAAGRRRARRGPPGAEIRCCATRRPTWRRCGRRRPCWRCGPRRGRGAGRTRNVWHLLAEVAPGAGGVGGVLRLLLRHPGRGRGRHPAGWSGGGRPTTCCGRPSSSSASWGVAAPAVRRSGAVTAGEAGEWELAARLAQAAAGGRPVRARRARSLRSTRPSSRVNTADTSRAPGVSQRWIGRQAPWACWIGRPVGQHAAEHQRPEQLAQLRDPELVLGVARAGPG